MTKIFIVSDLHMGHAEVALLAKAAQIESSLQALEGMAEASGFLHAIGIHGLAGILDDAILKGGLETLADIQDLGMVEEPKTPKLSLEGCDCEMWYGQEEPEEDLIGLGDLFAQLFGGVHDEPFEDEIPEDCNSAYGIEAGVHPEYQARAIFEDMAEQEGFQNADEITLTVATPNELPTVEAVAGLIVENFPNKIAVVRPMYDVKEGEELTSKDLENIFNHGFAGVDLETLLAPVPEYSPEQDLTKVEVMRKAIEEDGLSFEEAYELANLA